MQSKRIYIRAKAILFASAAAIGLLLLISSPAVADTLRYLPHGDQSLMQMTELIKNAKQTIDLTYYILDPCSASSKILLKLLMMKADEGVRVRMVVDANTHDKDLQKKFHELLRQKGIELRYYNRMRISANVNFRTHAKILLVDSRRYVTGGRNLADDYFGLMEDNFIDRDVYVEGRSAQKAQNDFNHFWNLKDMYTPGPSTPEAVDDLERNCMKIDAKTKSLTAALARGTKSTLAKTPVVQCSDVQFTFDDARFRLMIGDDYHRESGKPKPDYLSGARLYKKQTTKELMEFISDGTRNLVMENWSYIPQKAMSDKIAELRKKNVPVTVVTNHTTDVGGPVDVLNQHYSSRDNKGTQVVLGLSKLGTISGNWSETPKKAKWTIHSKVYITNFENVAVTSFNIDPRSYHTNIETGLFVRNCPAFADLVVSETGKLVDNYELDRNCTSCQHTPNMPFVEKVKAWLGHELM